MFHKTFLNELRERVSILSYVGARVPLKKAGRNYKGLCPFHAEKTPSFMVNEEKEMFHCFGCGEGGDVIRFAMKFEGLPFPDAVRSLAAAVGIALPEEDARSPEEEEREKRRKWAFRLNQLACDFYREALVDPEQGREARTYLEKRGVAESIWKQHFLGVADKGWDRLVRFLEKQRAPLPLAEELGLVRKRKDGGYYDFFRNRLIFPIFSPRGEVIAFGGRTLDPNEQVKYMNSPDSVLYHKSNTVYGLSHARKAIAKEDRVIIVEGYMDVIALAQAGIEASVAPLGTALTEGHVRLLSRYTKHPVLIFDGDAAGMKAMERALPLFLEQGIVIKGVALPKGEDPDSLVRKEGRERFERRIQEARSLFEVIVEAMIAEQGTNATGKIEVVKRAVPLLRQVQDPVEQELYRRRLTEKLELEERTVIAALGGDSRPIAATAKRSDQQKVLVESAERLLIRTLLRAPALITQAKKTLSADNFEDPWCRSIAKLLFQMADDEIPSIGSWLETLEDVELVGQLRGMILSDEELAAKDAEEIVRDCMKRLSQRPAQEELQRLNEEIKRAEGEKNDSHLFQLLTEKRKLMRVMR